jgi:hypothetical protein
MQGRRAFLAANVGRHLREACSRRRAPIGRKATLTNDCLRPSVVPGMRGVLFSVMCS